MSTATARTLYAILILLAFTVTLGYVATVRVWDRRPPLPRLERSSQSVRTRSKHTATLSVKVGQESGGGRGHRNVSEVQENLLEWKLFYGVESMQSDEDRWIMQKGHNHRTGVSKDVSNDSAYSHSSRVLLETVSKSFQERLYVGSPLSCHTGEEGLISVKYERFLRSLVNYASFHKISGGNNTRTLVWRCAWLEHCGGLADRLKGITYTLLLAIFSRRRLILNWGGIERTFLTPNLIDWTDGLAFNKTLDKGKTKQQYPVFHLMDGGDHVDSKGEDIKVTFESIGNETETVVLVSNAMPRYILSDVTAHQKWIRNGLRRTGLDSLSPKDLDNVLGILFRYLFQTKSELLEEVTRARRVLGLDGRPYTGVHIRTGFAGSSHSLEAGKHPKLVKSKAFWKATLKCAISTANTLLGNSSLLFLATDSVLVKNLAVSNYYYGARFRTLNNSLVHVDRLKLARKRAPSLNEKEGVVVSLVEFLLLAEAYSHVRGFSGYSWVAGLLCSLPGERVIDGLKCVPESQVKRYRYT